MSMLFKDPDELKSLIPNYRKDELELLRERPEYSEIYKDINEDLEKMVSHNLESIGVLFKPEYDRKVLDLVERVLSLNGWVCQVGVSKRDELGEKKVSLYVLNPFYKAKRKS